MGIGETRNLVWFFFPRSALFSKKTRKSILDFRRSEKQEINLENQYYKLASHW